MGCLRNEHERGERRGFIGFSSHGSLTRPLTVLLLFFINAPAIFRRLLFPSCQKHPPRTLTSIINSLPPTTSSSLKATPQASNSSLLTTKIRSPMKIPTRNPPNPPAPRNPLEPAAHPWTRNGGSRTAPRN